MARLIKIAGAFMDGLCGKKSSSCTDDKKMRDELSERQIDKMGQDSFPASDPPSTY